MIELGCFQSYKLLTTLQAPEIAARIVFLVDRFSRRFERDLPFLGKAYASNDATKSA